MKLVLMSDSHDCHDDIDLPEGDLLIHSGDMTSMGTINQITAVNSWFGREKHKFKYGIIAIAGNHDWGFQNNPDVCRTLMTNCTYLQDSSVVINGVKFYGSPWQPDFCNWAFNLPRGDDLKRKWSQIPDDTDVLITHGPPYKILDKVRPHRLNPDTNCGCKDLLDRVKELKQLKVHAFGHIHEHGGQIVNQDGVDFINAAVLNDRYRPSAKPVEYELIT